MSKDHIDGLIKAIDQNNDDAAKRHLAGLAYELLNLFQRSTAALERIAGTHVSDV